jgi:hypothetical protein
MLLLLLWLPLWFVTYDASKRLHSEHEYFHR